MTTHYNRPIETSSTTTALPPKPHSPPTSHKFASIHSTFALSTCKLVLRHHRHSTPPNHSLDYFYHSTLPTPHIHFTNSTHPLHHSPIHPHPTVQPTIPPPTTPPHHHTNQHYHTTIPPHQPTLPHHHTTTPTNTTTPPSSLQAWWLGVCSSSSRSSCCAWCWCTRLGVARVLLLLTTSTTDPRAHLPRLAIKRLSIRICMIEEWLDGCRG